MQRNNIFYISCTQGSIRLLVNATDAPRADDPVDDAWGRQRDPVTWIPYSYGNEPSLMFDRGYTGHEHLKEFGLINMNGRCYDPRIARMLSPDPFVQAGTFTQSYNRYSYAFNNPLAFTDPSGYANVGAGYNPFISHWVDNSSDGYKSMEKYWAGVEAFYEVKGMGKVGSDGSLVGSITEIFFASNGKINIKYYKGKPYFWNKYHNGFGFFTQRASNEGYLIGFAGKKHRLADIICDWTSLDEIIEKDLKTKAQKTYNISNPSGEVDGNISNPIGPYTSWVGVVAEAAKATCEEVENVGITVKRIKSWGTRTGWVGEGINIVISSVNFANNRSWSNFARLNNSIGTACLNLIPYAGPVLSFVVSAIDAEGGFDSHYNNLDFRQNVYDKYGILIITETQYPLIIDCN